MDVKKAKNLLQKGYVYLQKNDLSKAVQCFEKANKAYPRSFDIWFALSNVYSQLNIPEKTIAALKKAIEIAPDRYEAHGQLGVTYYSLQNLDEALICYKKVIALTSENLPAYLNLAITYIDLGQREEAIDCCEEVIKRQPAFTAAHILLGSAYTSLGQFEKSLVCYQKAVSLAPDNMSAIAGLADSLIKLGRKNEARDLLQKNIDRGKNEPAFVIAYAAIFPTGDCSQETAKLLESVLRSSGITPMQKLQLHFSAGQFYDRLQKYDLAFKHYAAGNRLSNRKYDAEKDNDLFDRIINVFDGSHRQREKYPSQTNQNVVPIFIIGMPRSGTSLVESIIGGHSKVFPAGELPNVPKMAEDLSSKSSNDRFPECIVDADGEVLDQFATKHIDFLSHLSLDSEFVTDKLPHNFLFLGLIESLFPNAIIIHCKRNPLDTCLSNYFQHFSGPLEYPYDLSNIANHYNNYQRLMAHWYKTIQLPILDVEYESLVTDQLAETEKLLSFLNLPMENACLEFDKSKQLTRTASFEQVREPVYTRSIDRWKHYRGHLTELIEGLSLKIE